MTADSSGVASHGDHVTEKDESGDKGLLISMLRVHA